MMSGIRMTTSPLHLRSPARDATLRPGVRADPLAAALVVAVALGVLALWIPLAAPRGRGGGAGGPGLVAPPPRRAAPRRRRLRRGPRRDRRRCGRPSGRG